MKKDSFYGRYIRPLIQHKVFALVMLYIVMILVFVVWSALTGKQFLKITTFKNILNSLVISSFLTIGAGCLLISGHIDLSQSAIGAFGGIILASAIKGWGLPWYMGIVLGLLLCAAFGAVNALLVTKYRFPSFIGTLAVASIARGSMYIFSSSGNNGTASNIAFINEPLSILGKGQIWGIPYGVIIMAVFFIVYGILVSKSKLGMKVSLMGGNPVAAMLTGINSTALMYILFINSAVLGGVAGIFNTARLGQGALMALQTNQYTGITAAILGGISFGGGAGGMGGAFVGLLILNTFQIGMGIVGVNPFWVNVFSGVLLLLALAVDFMSQRRARSRLTVS